MKIGWILLDFIVNAAMIYGLYSLTNGNGWVMALAGGLMIWNYIDGRVRSSWYRRY